MGTKRKLFPRKSTGRPSKYRPAEHPDAVRKLAGNGRTLADIAHLLNVSHDTVTKWTHAHPEFCVALKLGREDANDRVEKALFERATGYSHPTVKPMVVNGEIEMVRLTEQYPPDTPAALAWLKNKRPAEWKDRQELEHTGKMSLEHLLAAASAPPLADAACPLVMIDESGPMPDVPVLPAP